MKRFEFLILLFLEGMMVVGGRGREKGRYKNLST